MINPGITSTQYIKKHLPLNLGVRCAAGAIFAIATHGPILLISGCCAITQIFNITVGTILLNLHQHQKISARTSKIIYGGACALSITAMIVAGIAFEILAPPIGLGILAGLGIFKLIESFILNPLFAQYQQQQAAAAALAHQQAIAAAAATQQAQAQGALKELQESQHEHDGLTQKIQELIILQNQLQTRSLNSNIDVDMIQKSLQNINAIKGASGPQQTSEFQNLIDLLVSSKTSTPITQVDIAMLQKSVQDMVQNQLAQHDKLKKRLQIHANINIEDADRSQLVSFGDGVGTFKRHLILHTAHIERVKRCIELLMNITHEVQQPEQSAA
jgi:hypothetical protein